MHPYLCCLYNDYSILTTYLYFVQVNAYYNFEEAIDSDEELDMASMTTESVHD